MNMLTAVSIYASRSWLLFLGLGLAVVVLYLMMMMIQAEYDKDARRDDKRFARRLNALVSAKPPVDADSSR